MKADKKITEELSLKIAGFLSDARCIYEVQFDNRGGKRARYIFVRKPFACKIRISGHPSERVQKDMEHTRTPIFDVGPKPMSYPAFEIAFKQMLGQSA